MNPDIWDNAETGEPSSSSLPHVRAITTTAPTTLPPIPSFHDSPPGRHLSSATNPNPDPNPDPTSTTSTATATTTTTAQLEADALRAYYARASSPSGHASFSTWISAANTAERTANDAFDDRDDAGGGGGGEGQDLLDDGDDDFDDTNFVYENGRRYHANAEGRVLYPLPNDESEQERDDMKHKLAMWVMHEKLFYAPVEEALVVGGMVIDLGSFFFLSFLVLLSSLHHLGTLGTFVVFVTRTPFLCSVKSNLRHLAESSKQLALCDTSSSSRKLFVALLVPTRSHPVSKTRHGARQPASGASAETGQLLSRSQAAQTRRG